MNKKLLLLPLISVFLLCSCAIDKNTDQQSICAKTKRDLIFYQSDSNLNPQYSSTTKRAQLMDQYDKYHCQQWEQQQKTKPTQTTNTTPVTK